MLRHVRALQYVQGRAIVFRHLCRYASASARIYLAIFHWIAPSENMLGRRWNHRRSEALHRMLYRQSTAAPAGRVPTIGWERSARLPLCDADMQRRTRRSASTIEARTRHEHWTCCRGSRGSASLPCHALTKNASKCATTPGLLRRDGVYTPAQRLQSKSTLSN